MQKIVERIKQVILKPRETWEAVSKEELTISNLLRGYLLILAAVPALASLIGRWLIGIRIPFAGVYRFSFGASLLNAIIGYGLTIGSIWVAGRVISLLASQFGSTRNDAKGFQVAVYSYTPMLAAGVLNLIPSLAVLIFFAGLYGLFILYIGLPIVMGTPKEKSLPYIIVIIIILILISIIVSSVTGAVLGVFGPSLPRI